MESGALSPGELKRGRKSYYALAFFNVLSFQLITGNIITLFAIRLGAGNSLIGLISSFMYISLFFLFIGRLLVTKFGVVRLMGKFYLIRFALIIPMPLAVFFAAPEKRVIAFAFMIFAAAGFNIARGIAIVSDSPIVAHLAGTKDRGIFLSKVQIISQAMAIFSAFLMAFLLGAEAPLWRFAVIISIGILLGFISTIFIFRLPEPVDALRGAGSKILDSLAKAFSSRNTIIFFACGFLVHASAAMFGSFLVVYLKQVYAFPDNRLVLYSALANVGALVMAILSGLTMDRIGAKPLLFGFTFVSLISIFIAIVSPGFAGLPLMVYAGVLFFVWGMGSAGMGNSSLSYFIGLTDSSERVNYGIIYYFIVGLGGTMGSIAGGNALDFLLNTVALGAPESFRIYFSVIALVVVAILLATRSLENAGAYPIKDAIMFILSPRDMRALTLLRKLDEAETVEEESNLIEELRQVPSELAMDGVMAKVRSPSYQIRAQALEVLMDAPLDEKARQLLVSEVKNNEYTTGSLAARIIGNRSVHEGIPFLRKALRSPDTLLAGESMVALAKLGDSESIGEIEAILRETRNPRLIIHGAKALEKHRKPSSLETLLEKLESRQLPFIRDEIILSLAGLFGHGDWFYQLYVDFLEKAHLGVVELLDEILEQAKDIPEPRRIALQRLAEAIPKGGKEYRDLVLGLLPETSLTLDGTDIRNQLERAAARVALNRLPRFRFFLAAMLIHAFADK